MMNCLEGAAEWDVVCDLANFSKTDKELSEETVWF